MRSEDQVLNTWGPIPSISLNVVHSKLTEPSTVQMEYAMIRNETEMDIISSRKCNTSLTA